MQLITVGKLHLLADIIKKARPHGQASLIKFVHNQPNLNAAK
jgi:hypothetical protein